MFSGDMKQSSRSALRCAARPELSLQVPFGFAATAPPPPVTPSTRPRFAVVSDRKATGATYTPPELAEYLGAKLVAFAGPLLEQPRVRILDPALGDGSLAIAIIEALARHAPGISISFQGYETDAHVARTAQTVLSARFPATTVQVAATDFLARPLEESFDLIIANPPYIRTQVLGAEEAQSLSERFGLTGRIDMYHAFLLAMIDALAPNGLLAAITSNRFLTTRGAGTLRRTLRERLHLERIWDLGDTKLFDAAVLPAMILGRHAGAPGEHRPSEPQFTTVYEVSELPGSPVSTVVSALDERGVFVVPSGRRFEVRQGTRATTSDDSSVWRLSSPDVDSWLSTVASRTWMALGDLGKIRVGVKTTADSVFIRDDWASFARNERPELLRPLITHHVAERFKARVPTKQILYPHAVVDGARCAVDLKKYPRAAKYLQQHRAALESRKYVATAGRQWYEIWVPQDPSSWDRPKLVFRDIAERPTFWLDHTGSVVNGDCYWMVPAERSNDALLWLALAVANTTFIEAFYDRKFNNKLYAGRRRFMTQYVEQFPIPDPTTPLALRISALAQRRYAEDKESERNDLEDEIDDLVWSAFGLSPECTRRVRH
jgi:tRNA1(Val) A37 N6-methylase TrmN6